MVAPASVAYAQGLKRAADQKQVEQESRSLISRKLIVLGLLAIGAALVVVLINLFAGALSCSFDTSYCADSTEKHGLYRGQLIDPATGAAYASRSFSVAFESRDQAGRPRVDFTTDPQGRFCIQWPSERIVPFVYPEYLRVPGEEAAGLRDWVDINTDAQIPGCQKGDGGVPWFRADTLHSSWQYIVLIALPLLAASALALALLSRRRPRAPRVLTAGFVLLGTSVLATVLLWM